MANFYAFYPPGSAGSSANASVGPNGAPITSSSTLVAGENPSGNQQPLQTDASGALIVTPEAGSTGNVNLTEVGGAAISEGQKTMANSLPVVIASDQSAIPISASALPLPTGAATAANQTNGSQETQIVQGGNTAIVSAAGALKVDGSAVTQPISAAALPLPTGASTSALQSNVQSAPGTPQTVALTIQGNASSVPVPISGTVTASNPSVGATGSAVPANTTYMGMNVGGTNVGLTGTNVGGTIESLNVNIAGATTLAVTAAQSNPALLKATVIGDSAAGSGDSTGLVTVQGNASGTPIPISGSVTITPSGTQNENLIQINGSTVVSAAAGIQKTGISGATGVTLDSAAGSANAQAITVQGNASGIALPISAAALPLPTGASTSALQSNVQSAPGTPQTVALTIQGNASGVPVPISGSITATNPSVGLTGTTAPTSATEIGIISAGNLVGVSATNPLPITGSITASNPSVGTNGATAPTSSTELGAINPSGNLQPLQTDSLNNLDIVSPDLYVTGAAAQTATVNNILTTTSGTAATDASNYKALSVQVVSTGTGGTFIFEGSNDNVNFQSIPVYNQLILTGTPITTAITASASQFIYTLPLHFRYVRLRIATAITGGSIQAFSRFTQHAWSPSVFDVAQATAANLNVTATLASTTVASTTSVFTNADQASAAITTTTTSATKALTAGTAVSFNVAITAVSGTTPTYDFAVQTSIDGANWNTVYQMPRMTGVGFFNTPALQLNGIDYRYIETIGGTTPSFTRTITTNRELATGISLRNLIDRTIAPATTNSTTASLNVEGTTAYSMIVSQGTGGSAVTFALDGSDDNATWVQGIAVVTGNLNVAPVSCSYSGSQFRYIRARVLTGVASATINYVTLIGGPVNLTQNGRGSATVPVQNIYSSTNITTSAYVQLVASTLAAVNVVDIFDSSGQAMILAVGPSGQEVIQAYIPPGGETQMPISIPAGSRVAYKALSANATSGYLLMNFLT